jgi:hypothetical protein
MVSKTPDLRKALKNVESLICVKTRLVDKRRARLKCLPEIASQNVGHRRSAALGNVQEQPDRTPGTSQVHVIGVGRQERLS